MESKGKVPHLFIPSKTAAWIPEFAVEDLLLGRTAAFVPALGSEGLALGQNTLMMMMMMMMMMMIGIHKKFMLKYKNEVSYLTFTMDD